MCQPCLCKWILSANGTGVECLSEIWYHKPRRHSRKRTNENHNLGQEDKTTT